MADSIQSHSVRRGSKRRRRNHNRSEPSEPGHTFEQPFDGDHRTGQSMVECVLAAGRSRNRYRRWQSGLSRRWRLDTWRYASTLSHQPIKNAADNPTKAVFRSSRPATDSSVTMSFVTRWVNLSSSIDLTLTSSSRLSCHAEPSSMLRRTHTQTSG